MSVLVKKRSGDFAKLDTIGTTTAGWGSSSTKVARFVNTAVRGNDLSITQSATLGDSITVNTAGEYLVEGLIVVDGTAVILANIITKNAVDFTTSPEGNQIAGTIARGQGNHTITPGGANPISKIVTLVVNDVLRLHGAGSFQDYHSEAYFQITRVA